jgi:hypothetical protein
MFANYNQRRIAAITNISAAETASVEGPFLNKESCPFLTHIIWYSTVSGNHNQPCWRLSIRGDNLVNAT